MKRTIIVLLMLTLIPCVAFTQSISYPKIIGDSVVAITKTQLLKTNLIFLEHKKLLEEVPQLFTQIKTLKQINDNLNKVDSLRINEQDLFKKQICLQEDSIKGLKKSLSASKRKIRIRNWTIFGFSIVGAGLTLYKVFK